MSTLNLLPYIATQNSFSRREERVPVWIHSKVANYQIPESLNLFTNQLEDYLNGIRLFGQEQGRKEDGYGERTYHLKDLEEIINIYRSIGLAKSYPDFIQDFPADAGWAFVNTEVLTTTHENQERYERKVTLNGESLDDIAKAIQDGTCLGLDCVDWNGVIHRGCKLLKISDLHPSTTKTIKVLDEVKEKYVDQEIEVPGVNSELYLIITPECMEKGFSTVEGEDEPTLKASPYLRTPLGFVTMRRSRAGEIPTRFPKGTALLKSICPVTSEYHVFDSLLAKATLVVQDTRIPGVIYKSIVQHNQQAFLTEEHLKAQTEMLDYILSPEDQEDGIASVYKGWMKLTGQHFNFDHILNQARTIFDAKPRVIDETGARGGNDLKAALMKVVDIKFNIRWAIIGEFEAILNPNGTRTGTSAITAANPVPYYIHTLNPETLKWEKDPITKWVFADMRGRKYFSRNEDPFTLIDVKTLEPAELKPLPDIYRLINDNHKEMAGSVKDKPTA